MVHSSVCLAATLKHLNVVEIITKGYALFSFKSHKPLNRLYGTSLVDALCCIVKPLFSRYTRLCSSFKCSQKIILCIFNAGRVIHRNLHIILFYMLKVIHQTYIISHNIPHPHEIAFRLRFKI